MTNFVLARFVFFLHGKNGQNFFLAKRNLSVNLKLEESGEDLKLSQWRNHGVPLGYFIKLNARFRAWRLDEKQSRQS